MPQVVSPKTVRLLDFGSGFYTTTSQDQALKDFYMSPVYAQLEQEDSKYWWKSPDQLAQIS